MAAGNPKVAVQLATIFGHLSKLKVRASIRLTATVIGKWSWTAKLSRSDVLDIPQRHSVT
jgi:hypothetical protein